MKVSMFNKYKVRNFKSSLNRAKLNIKEVDSSTKAKLREIGNSRPLVIKKLERNLIKIEN